MPALLLLSLHALACGESLTPGSGSVDGGAASHDDARVDGGTSESDADGLDADADANGPGADGGDASMQARCQAQQEKVATFVSAHRSCSVDDDCAIVGDCSHANFQSVARHFANEAQALVLADECGWNDGPTYNAVCRAGLCERVLSPVWCGNPPQTACPDGMERFTKGCGEIAPTFRDGCHAECTGASDSCMSGYTCQETVIDPCGQPLPGQSACAACGRLVSLCLPPPACQVEFSLALDGHPVAQLTGMQSTRLQLWIENLTDQVQTLRFDVPCHGPIIQGLGNYDVWQSCLAGACMTDPVPTELTLAPRQKLQWKSAVLASAPSDCSPLGLPTGTYAPTFSLSAREGAITCGPTPVKLVVAP